LTELLDLRLWSRLHVVVDACVDLCVSEPLHDDAPVEANNPFQANGELRRKADYIITHSRISRTEMRIADPDDDKDTANSSRSSSSIRDRNEELEIVDGPVTSSSPASTVEHQPQTQHQTRRHDDETTVVTVTSSVTTPLCASTAEKVTVKKKKRCTVQ